MSYAHLKFLYYIFRFENCERNKVFKKSTQTQKEIVFSKCKCDEWKPFQCNGKGMALSLIDFRNDRSISSLLALIRIMQWEANLTETTPPKQNPVFYLWETKLSKGFPILPYTRNFIIIALYYFLYDANIVPTMGTIVRLINMDDYDYSILQLIQKMYTSRYSLINTAIFH